MNTSGLVLDFNDDVNKEQLRSIYPTWEDIPVCVKEASAPLSSEDLNRLPDDLFALVLVNGDVTLRKYACYDEGITALNIEYFLRNAHKLPEEAQKVAASNLCIAASYYSLPISEELSLIGNGERVKVGGVGTLMSLAALPSTVRGTANEIGRRRGAVQAAQMQGAPPAVTPEQVRDILKQGDVTGTSDMPLSVDSQKKITTQPAVIRKTSGIVASKSEVGKPDTNLEHPVNSKPPLKAPQIRPHVDVTGKTAAAIDVRRYVQNYALNGRYPIDSYYQVKQAAEYFKDNCFRFDPSDRHTYCCNLVKRANDLCIELSPEIRKYGSTNYAPTEEINMALETRRNILTNPHAIDLLNKIAETRPELPPDAFCDVLSEFDKVAGIDVHWDSNVIDPYFSTYGYTEKTSSEKIDTFVDVIANSRITGAQLHAASQTRRKAIGEFFGCDMAEEFAKDPVGIYSSLPREQKLQLINLASDNAPGIRGSDE